MFDRRTVAVALAAAMIGSAVGAGAISVVQPSQEPARAEEPDPVDPEQQPFSLPGDDDPDEERERLGNADVEQFDSEEEFRAYVQRNRQSSVVALRQVLTVRRGQADVAMEATEANEAGGAPTNDGGGGSDRISGTNVQERGIDEPDVLKTNGEVAFYAGASDRRGGPTAPDTTVLDVSEAGDPAVVGDVPAGGQLLLADDVLVVQNDRALYGYDVSEPGNPQQLWRKELNASVVTARLLDGEVYLVTRSGIDLMDPCPVAPFGADGPAVECSEIYHPTRGATAEVTYTTSVLDPESGDVRDSVSVVGSRQHQATYVSENAVYLTYSRQASHFELFSTFLLNNKSDVLDDLAERRIRELRELNISQQAKAAELRVILQRWYQRMPDDRREEVREAISEDFQAFLNENRRDLVRTGIVRIDVGDGLSVEATGEVPGYPLNQFSMDESDGRLRIATTVGRRWGGQTSNDLYVLDEDLEIVGSETGMADNERIFSVRFVEDTAYLVTFRRIDPFHVVDLSNPEDPTELGNVELPGFSRYLHPIGENRVLGIGEEDGHVKAVIFDVSNPSTPVVEDDLILDDRWSAVSRTHHAFLQDERHGVFFLPGSRGGYVIDYTEGDLSVERRVETVGAARRAMYHDDYLYVFDEEGMVVLDETDWSTVERIDFDRARRDEESGDERVPSIRPT